jgi:hypothetical protein
MAMTNKERQAEYRRKRKGDGGKCLSVVLDDGADLALHRLIRHWGKIRRETILRLLEEADLSLIRGLLDDEEGGRAIWPGRDV